MYSGKQEGDAALRFLEEVVGQKTNAEIESCWQSGVRIFANDQLVVEVSQRDMYRKYGWPAKDRLQKAIREFLASEDNVAKNTSGAASASSS